MSLSVTGTSLQSLYGHQQSRFAQPHKADEVALERDAPHKQRQETDRPVTETSKVPERSAPAVEQSQRAAVLKAFVEAEARRAELNKQVAAEPENVQVTDLPEIGEQTLFQKAQAAQATGSALPAEPGPMAKLQQSLRDARSDSAENSAVVKVEVLRQIQEDLAAIR